MKSSGDGLSLHWVLEAPRDILADDRRTAPDDGNALADVSDQEVVGEPDFSQIEVTVSGGCRFDADPTNNHDIRSSLGGSF